jgi:predicted dehydrogenase
MDPISRRKFLETTAVGGSLSALALGGALAAEEKGAGEKVSSSPNSVVRIGVIGVRGRGNSQIQQYLEVPGAQVVALCDVDESILNSRADSLTAKARHPVKKFTDLRRLIDDPNIDAVSIATPNHWHTLAAIWAMQAGKDAYVEKPCSHDIWEGRQLVLAARKYNRMCQHGTQGRTAPAIREAMAKLHEGVIGRVYMARGLCFKTRDDIGKTPDSPVPPGVHYDLWLGPAPLRAFSANRFHYNWHWNWDYGNGDIGNQGVHEMDMARWGLGVGLPKKVHAAGGKFLFDDDKETPNVLTTAFEYPDENKLLEFEVRPWLTNHEGFKPRGGNETGVTFYGSEGYMQVYYFGYKTYRGRKLEPGPASDSDSNEMGTFVAAVRSRKRADLGVDIEEGHLSSALCHLGNMAYRLGRTITFDPQTETCPGDDAANALLKRKYREPFVVPAMG